MTRTTIVQVESKFEINDVKDVVVTSIEIQEDGQFVREWRFFGTPNDPTSSANPMSLVVRCVADTKAALEITTPALQV